jgi:hypothetical protein
MKLINNQIVDQVLDQIRGSVWDQVKEIHNEIN